MIIDSNLFVDNYINALYNNNHYLDIKSNYRLTYMLFLVGSNYVSFYGKLFTEVINLKFEEKLLALRKQKKISQENLAEELGITRQAVARWELGQSYPDVDKLILLSDFFKVSIDNLVKNNTDENCAYKGHVTNNIEYMPIIEFLCRAKKNTFAGHGSETTPSRPNSHDLNYMEDNLKYIDTYVGGKKFAGEEAVWLNDSPIWAMNYVGRLIGEGYSGKFLSECLSLVTIDLPFRGPLVHTNGDYSYHCIINGDFEWFTGYEEMFCKNIKVYECNFHGGYVNG